MTRLVRLWFGLTEPVSRTAYALTGFGLMGLKYAVEASLVHLFTGRWLKPLDYLSPLISPRQDAVGDTPWLLGFLVLWTLPFLWVGVSMTLRRAEDAGWPGSLAVTLFFVPFVNDVVMIALCLLPSREGIQTAPPPPHVADGAHAVRSAILGVAIAVGIAVAMVGISVIAFGTYGTVLFLATPFLMGGASAAVFNAREPRGIRATLGVAAFSVCAAGGVILVLALEGAVCLAMAAPPAVVMAAMGAVIGRALATRHRLGTSQLAMMVLPLPLLAGVEARHPSPAPVEVVSVVEIDAPPEVVWRHVVAFSDLREPPAWFFRLGIAYPRRATIDGIGAGAVRRCEFSTGAFVEPISVWDEPRRLAFGVSEQPPPMTEWSPFRNVAAPHLDGYLAVRGGAFDLVPLAGGRTRLEGRTRYDMRIFPAAYWQLWSNAVIHAIHLRVLEHIKSLAETSAAS